MSHNDQMEVSILRQAMKTEEAMNNHQEMSSIKSSESKH